MQTYFIRNGNIKLKIIKLKIKLLDLPIVQQEDLMRIGIQVELRIRVLGVITVNLILIKGKEI